MVALSFSLVFYAVPKIASQMVDVIIVCGAPEPRARRKCSDEGIALFRRPRILYPRAWPFSEGRGSLIRRHGPCPKAGNPLSEGIALFRMPGIPYPKAWLFSEGRGSLIRGHGPFPKAGNPLSEGMALFRRPGSPYPGAWSFPRRPRSGPYGGTPYESGHPGFLCDPPGGWLT